MHNRNYLGFSTIEILKFFSYEKTMYFHNEKTSFFVIIISKIWRSSYYAKSKFNRLRYGDNKMKKILLVPCALFPYVLLFNVFCIYTDFLMEEVFQNFILVMILYLFIYVIFVLICNIAYIIICKTKNIEPKEIAKANMIIKMVQIPGYIAVFILGLICLITIFTIGFSFFFFLYDCISIFLTGIVGASAIFAAKNKNEKLSIPNILLLLTEFVFCIDIFSSVVLYSRIGKISNNIKENKEADIEIKEISKVGLLTYLGVFMFGLMLALSEVFFPNLENFFGVNVLYDVFFTLSIVISISGLIVSVIKKNKNNSSRKEYIVEVMITVISFITMIAGIIFSDTLLGKCVFSFGSGIFILNILGYIQTFFGMHKKM